MIKITVGEKNEVHIPSADTQALKMSRDIPGKGDLKDPGLFVGEPVAEPGVDYDWYSQGFSSGEEHCTCGCNCRRRLHNVFAREPLAPPRALCHRLGGNHRPSTSGFQYPQCTVVLSHPFTNPQSPDEIRYITSIFLKILTIGTSSSYFSTLSYRTFRKRSHSIFLR